MCLTSIIDRFIQQRQDLRSHFVQIKNDTILTSFTLFFVCNHGGSKLIYLVRIAQRSSLDSHEARWRIPISLYDLLEVQRVAENLRRHFPSLQTGDIWNIFQLEQIFQSLMSSPSMNILFVMSVVLRIGVFHALLPISTYSASNSSDIRTFPSFLYYIGCLIRSSRL